jgi:integrase
MLIMRHAARQARPRVRASSQSVARSAPRGGAALDAGSVRVLQAFTERRSPGGKISLGPPKSKAARRVVGIPAVIIPALRGHLAAAVKPEPDALIFPGPMGAPLRRRNFNRAVGWSHVVAAIGAPGLHFHDLRHTGNTFAAATGGGA